MAMFDSQMVFVILSKWNKISKPFGVMEQLVKNCGKKVLLEFSWKDSMYTRDRANLSPQGSKLLLKD